MNTQPALAFAHLLEARRRMALMVLRQLMACEEDMPAAVAREAGLTPEHFADEDLRILADVMLLNEPYTLTARLRAAKLKLNAAHLWDRTEIAGNELSQWWSDAKLARLAKSVSYSGDTLRLLIRDMLAISEHIAALEAASNASTKARMSQQRQKGRAA